MDGPRPSGMKHLAFRILSLVLGLVVVLITLEVLFLLYYLMKDRGYVSVTEKLSRERSTHFRDIARDGCRSADFWLPHPYLGYVYHGNPPCGAPDLNNINVHGRDFPFTKAKDKFVILVTGGSVAEQFAGLFKRSPRYLETILNQRYEIPGKQFVVLNGAVGSWKQPQQAILFLLYADVVDAVITIDGHNEYWHIDGPLRFEFPDYRIVTIPTLLRHSFDEMGWTWVSTKIYQFTTNNWLLSHSKLAYFLSHSLRQIITADTSDDTQHQLRLAAYHLMFALPKDWPVDERIRFNVELYRKYILAMNDLARSRNLRTAHFIQPIPQIGKPLTGEERKILEHEHTMTRGTVIDPVKYSAMTDALVSLSSIGIPVFSLLDVFSDSRETIYSDPVHCTRAPDTDYSRGYELMAERIASHLETAWNLLPKRAR